MTVTDATGTPRTVRADVPLFPSLVAVIVAEPGARPVTSPLPETVAITVSLDVQVTTRPVSGVPFASVGDAASCTVEPTCTLAGDGVTATAATGTVATVTPDVPLTPSLVAVIVVVPAAIAATNPFPPTVATAVLLLDQVTTRPDSALPLASFAVAVSCSVCPTDRLAGEGLTLTEATGTGITITVAVSDRPPGCAIATTWTCPGVAAAW